MAIPTYQIHNVLKIFSQRLYEEARRKQRSPVNDLSTIQRVSIAADGKRRSITDRVTAEIFNRLNRSSASAFARGAAGSASPPESGPLTSGPTEFTYHLIDSFNRKMTATLSVEDPSVLIGRLEDLTAEETQGPVGPDGAPLKGRK